MGNKTLYVIATYNGKKTQHGRTHNVPSPGNVLTLHLENLKRLRHSCTVLVSEAESSQEFASYYKNSPQTLKCKNYGYSMGQWLNAYSHNRDFDYYIFVEDDYCFNIHNFDIRMVNEYKSKFTDNIGLLCTMIEKPGKYPLHFEGFVLVSRETMQIVWGDNTLETFEEFSKKVPTTYEGARYQVAFSQLFTSKGIKHAEIEDPIFPYWNDTRIMFLKDGTEYSRYTFGPIQLSELENKTYYNNYKNIIFVIGMHRCGTSLLTSSYNRSLGTTVNRDTNWQNPLGYFENDAFTNFHERLLRYNNWTWKTPRGRGKFTGEHVKEYRKLIKAEFSTSECIIKDPRLSFFEDFIHKVCENTFNYRIIFCTRSKEECIQSLMKAQGVSRDVATNLYDNSHEMISHWMDVVDYKESHTLKQFDPKLYRNRL